MNTGERPRVFECRGARLLAISHGSGDAATGVLFVAGGGQYRVGSHRLYVQLARSLAAAGTAAFRFDHRGVGDSTGEFRGFEHLAPDIGAAIEAFREDAPAVRNVVVLGLCDGASAALLAARAHPEIAGLVLINPWVYSSGLEARTRFASYYLARLRSREFWGKVARGQLDLAASVHSLGRYFRDLFRDEAADGSAGGGAAFVGQMLDSLRKFPGEVLVVLSGQDLAAQQFQQLVTHDRLWKDALERENVEITKFPAADHTFSYAEQRGLVESHVTDWLSRCMPATAGSMDGRGAGG